MILFASFLILALVAFAAFPLLFGWTCRRAWEKLTSENPADRKDR